MRASRPLSRGPLRVASIGGLAGALAIALTATPTADLPATATTAAAAPAVAGSTTAYAPTSADARIAAKLNVRATTRTFGTAFTGAVVDAASGQVVWSKWGTTGRMPASTAKWATATDALAVFGAASRFTTTVRKGAGADMVYLVGSGDPSLSSAQLASLAATTAAAMKADHRLTVRLYADDTLFPPPTMASGWRPTTVPDDTTWLRALVVDGRQVPDTTIDAAVNFAAKLKANGVTVTRIARAKAPASSPVLASSVGRPISQLVSMMMLYSDNEYAEALHRLVAIRTGYGNTWAAASAAQRHELADEGLTATALYDGSGLSRSDRLTALELSHMVTNIFEPGNATKLALLRSDTGLPISGQTGTLKASYKRFVTPASKCAVGKVHAKTGTLSDAVALSGWTVGTDGRVKAFAFVVNGLLSTLALRQAVDMLAATVVGCY